MSEKGEASHKRIGKMISSRGMCDPLSLSFSFNRAWMCSLIISFLEVAMIKCSRSNNSLTVRFIINVPRADISNPKRGHEGLNCGCVN